MKSIAIRSVLGTIIIFLFAIVAPAAEIALSAAIAGTYSADGLTVNSSTGAVFDGQYHAYRVDLFALLTGTIGPTESFGATYFDVVLGSGLSRLTTNTVNVRINWQANNPLLGPLEAEPYGYLDNYWVGGDNADLGVSATDLKSIVQDIDGSNLGKLPYQDPDPRLSIGRGSPFKLGSVYVQYNSGGPQATLSFANASYSLADTSHLLIFQQSVSTTITPVIFGVPEPTALSLFFAGALVCVGIRLIQRRISGLA